MANVLRRWDGRVMNLDPTLPMGRRIKILRGRRGLSRAVVAGLCGRSESWLKKIEQGTRQAVRLPTLLRLAPRGDHRCGFDPFSVGAVTLSRPSLPWLPCPAG
ncbi:MAG: helix-turn-helix domain-containing protein [Pseudonocardiaceae bacterium]